VGVRVTIFVSVDQSTDGSETWLDQRAVADNRIVLLPHGAVFGGAAANFFRLLRMVNFAEFDCVSLADQDDVWHTHKLQRACRQLQASGAEGYSSNVWAFWPNGRRVSIVKSQPQVAWDFLFEAAGPGCTYVLRQPLALALQGFLQLHHARLQQVGLHDWFIYAYARSHGWRWLIDPEAHMDYRQHSSNQVGANQGWIAMRYRAGLVINGWALSQAALIAGILGLQHTAFVASWQGRPITGLLKLALQARLCRRRRRDQVFFGLSCLLLAAVHCGRPSKIQLSSK